MRSRSRELLAPTRGAKGDTQAIVHRSTSHSDTAARRKKI
jgi:hypothetical protein